MALWDKLMGEPVDIVEWLDDTNDTLTYRFERYQVLAVIVPATGKR